MQIGHRKRNTGKTGAFTTVSAAASAHEQQDNCFLVHTLPPTGVNP